MIESLRRDWISYAWTWAFVAWYILVGLTVDAFGYGRAFFWISVPLFFYCFYRGSQPWFQGSATYLQMALWAMLFPFLLAIPLAALWHAAEYVVRGSSSYATRARSTAMQAFPEPRLLVTFISQTAERPEAESIGAARIAEAG